MVLHSWLLHSKNDDCRTFLIELLKLYKQLPVTVDLLRQNSCAKDIKQLSKSADASTSCLLSVQVLNESIIILVPCSSDNVSCCN